MTQSHLDVHPKGALLTEGDHQPLSAVAEVELPAMTEQCRFAMRTDAKSQGIGPAMESLGQQAAQQHPAEQVLMLATRLVDLVPVTAFIRGEFGCQPDHQVCINACRI